MRNIKIHITLLLLLKATLAPAQGLIIPSGSYVIQEGGNFIMGQNFTNNGSFTQNDGAVVFDGSTQEINGTTPTTFKNILVNNGSTTTVTSSGHSLTDVIISDGTLDANGNLTMISNASQTALVEGSSTGDVLDIIMQRYLPSAFGYKYFSSAFQAATVNEFSDDIDLNAAFPPIYRYEEDHSSTGWFFNVNPASTLVPLKGYAVNFGTSQAAATADMRGDVNNGVQSVSLFNNNRTYTQGFNLVGNPYPSPIDWDAASGWTRTNIDDAIYYFDAGNSDQYGGTYSSYINGISSNGIANNIIPSMQGFFVHVSDGSYPVAGTLEMTNAVRVNNLSPVFHKLPGIDNPVLRINTKFSNTDAWDHSVIYFEHGAGMGFEMQLDALKMMNTDPHVPSLYIASPDGNKLSISAMPYPADSIQIVPLGIKAETDGEVAFSITDIDNMPYGTNIYFADAKNQTITEARPEATYKAQLSKGEHQNRFSIVFAKKPLPADIFTRNELNAYSTRGKIYVYLNLITGEKGDLAIVNTLGQVIGKYHLNGYGYHEIPAQLVNGVYIASFYSGTGVFSKKLFIGSN